MIIRRTGVGATLALLTAWACTDDVPTFQDRDFIPVDAQTYEVFLPYEAFAADFRTFRGFGTAAQLGSPILAFGWSGEDDPEGGTLEARPLVRFGLLPDSIMLVVPGEDGAQPDHEFVPVSGRLTLMFDTVGAGEDPVNVIASATQAAWDRGTVSWEMGVDSVGDRRPWPEPGGGPVREIGSANWLPQDGDSITIDVDSLTVTEWADREAEFRGLVLSTDTEGTRVRLREAFLRVEVRPSILPDTLILLPPQTRQFTFIYDPTPEAEPGTFQIGGTPAQRATFRLTLPEVLDGGPEICQFVPCPMELRAEEILFASLVLTSATTTPVALRPRDDFSMSARVVLAPDRLPRSPLGRSVQPFARPLDPLLFQSGSDLTVEVPMTRFVQELAAALRADEEGPPATIALLSQPEPGSLDLATFRLPGGFGSPQLRLILTISEGVTLP